MRILNGPAQPQFPSVLSSPACFAIPHELILQSQTDQHIPPIPHLVSVMTTQTPATPTSKFKLLAHSLHKKQKNDVCADTIKNPKILKGTIPLYWIPSVSTWRTSAQKQISVIIFMRSAFGLAFAFKYVRKFIHCCLYQKPPREPQDIHIHLYWYVSRNEIWCKRFLKYSTIFGQEQTLKQLNKICDSQGLK